MKIHCPDGAIFIDANPFCRECRIAEISHKYGSDDIMVDINRKLIEKIKNFIMGRAERAGNSDDLTKFNSEFREINKGCALELITAAFEMGIKSLIELLLKDVDAIFTQMNTDEQFYKYFPVNFNNEEFDSYQLKLLSEELKDSDWAFFQYNSNNSSSTLLHSPTLTINRSFQMEIDATSDIKNEKMRDASEDKRRLAIDDDLKKLTHNKIPRKENMVDKQIAMTHDVDSCKRSRAKEKCNWVIKLLRVPFHEYRTTLSDEERLQWLATHFFVNRASSALYVENVIGKKGILHLLIREGEKKDRATMEERQAHCDGVNPQGVLG